ncbi:MAG: tRNA pseudouridine(55) synthase TruB [Gammaproteobacteria bacterium]|nr:tRNA pseudouridine(55) synthase TruB [Gammaproteobacteria bacterium]
MGRRNRRGRDVTGVFILDKPRGITSNAALQRLKYLYQAKKAGHTGSLDRLASGLLPICFGEATKLSGYLLDADKRYETRLTLGATTTTGDEEGEIKVRREVGDYSAAQLEAVLERFRGPIEQIPPMHSALKQNGKRLYKLAHRGIEVPREARPVTIRELSVTQRGDGWLMLDVLCTKGTYIRTLGEDIGEALGCGAHVSTLRRTQAGPFDASNMHTLDDVEALLAEGPEALDQMLRPLGEALPGWPSVRLSGDLIHYLRQGQPVLVPRAPTSGWVRMDDSEGQLVGLGEVQDDGKIAPRRLIGAATSAVIE